MMLEDLYQLLQSSHVQAQGIVDTLSQPLVVLDENFCVVNVNNAFVETFQAQRDRVLGRSLFDLGNGQWDIEELRHLIARIIPKAAAVIGYEVSHDFPSIGPRTFLVDARRLVQPDSSGTNILVLFEDVTERQRAQVTRDFVLSETRHRMKNMFAVVRSLAMQTETANRNAEEYREALLRRLDVALAAQELSWEEGTTDFATMLKNAVGSVGIERLHVEGGPLVRLTRSHVLPLSMLFHELTTNAMKYGALSVAPGEVHVGWGVAANGEDGSVLTCAWREEHGPAVAPPKRRGYGSDLIVGTAKHLGGEAELNFDVGGLAATIKIPL